MMDGIRVVLIDPSQASRQSLLEQLEATEPVWLAEVCVAYRIAPARVAEIRPDVIIIAADANPELATEAIGAILKEDPQAVVLAASRSSDSNVILKLIRRGAREVLPLPVQSDELLRTLKRLTQRVDEVPVEVPADPKSKIIAITGASGEVGCTSIAVNLATTLAKTSGQEVVLADLDLMFGGIDNALDLVPKHTLADVVKSVDRIDLTLLKRMMTRHASGLYVLPRPAELQESATLDPECLHRTLLLLKEAFPIIVIDTSKSLQTSDFVAFEMAEVILLVTQLEATVVRNTTRLIQCFREFENLATRVKLIANRVGSLRSVVPLKMAEESFQMPITWQIPNATKVFHAARDRGVPLDSITSRGEAQRVIAQIARDLVPSAQPKVVKAQRGFFRDRFSREA